MSAVLHYALVLWLSSASVSLNLPTLTIQRRTKTFGEYMQCVKREALAYSKEGGVSAGPWKGSVASSHSDFYATVTVGTPPQTFSVILRTDTTGMWIPSAMCPVETYDVCKDHRRYDHDKSKTYVRGGQMMGYGGMVAELSYDTVGIAGQSIQGQCFAEAIQYKYSDSSIPYDGLLGLGIVQHIFSNDTSMFRNMVSQNIIDEIVYGLYFLKNSSDPSKSGGLVIGGRDPSVYAGDLIYVNSTYDTLWQFVVDEVLLFDPDLTKLCEGCTAVPSTGSHYISSSSKLMDELHQRLGATAFMDDHTYQFNCDNLHNLKPVYFRIGETLFAIPWQSYVDRVMGPLGEIICLSAFTGGNDNLGNGASDGFSLGDAFFTSVYVEFDADNQRMGFGQLISSL